MWLRKCAKSKKPPTSARLPLVRNKDLRNIPITFRLGRADPILHVFVFLPCLCHSCILWKHWSSFVDTASGEVWDNCIWEKTWGHVQNAAGMSDSVKDGSGDLVHAHFCSLSHSC